jgi:hypothetical protein
MLGARFMGHSKMESQKPRQSRRGEIYPPTTMETRRRRAIGAVERKALESFSVSANWTRIRNKHVSKSTTEAKQNMQKKMHAAETNVSRADFCEFWKV